MRFENISTQILEQGDHYEVPRGAVHTSVVNSWPTITLIERSKILKEDPINYKRRVVGQLEKTFDIEQIDQRQAQYDIMDMLEKLKYPK